MLNKIKLWKNSQGKLDDKERESRIVQQPVPNHIAIIMDGNGRWAKKGLSPELLVIMKE